MITGRPLEELVEALQHARRAYLPAHGLSFDEYLGAHGLPARAGALRAVPHECASQSSERAFLPTFSFASATGGDAWPEGLVVNTGILEDSPSGINPDPAARRGALPFASEAPRAAWRARPLATAEISMRGPPERWPGCCTVMTCSSGSARTFGALRGAGGRAEISPPAHHRLDAAGSTGGSASIGPAGEVCRPSATTRA